MSNPPEGVGKEKNLLKGQIFSIYNDKEKHLGVENSEKGHPKKKKKKKNL